jgi:hypothetical protein
MLVDYSSHPRLVACHYLQCKTLFEVIIPMRVQENVIMFGVLVLFTLRKEQSLLDHSRIFPQPSQ